jgi:hypothetical protein
LAMSWRAVDDELLNLERLVRTMEEEEEGQLVRTKEEEEEGRPVRTMNEEEGQLARTMEVKEEEGRLARTMEVEEEGQLVRTMEEEEEKGQLVRTMEVKEEGQLAQTKEVEQEGQLMKTNEEEEGRLVKTNEEEGQLARTIKEEGEGQLPAGPHSRSGDELKIKETGTERGKDLNSFRGGRTNEDRPSVLVGKDRGQGSSYRSGKAEDPRSPDPLPVSRLLDELKHFDKDKGLRKVKIEISLEDRGWGESSLRRRLSESSLENNEAVRYAAFQYNAAIFKNPVSLVICRVFCDRLKVSKCVAV